jgi:hypothetical protein
MIKTELQSRRNGKAESALRSPEDHWHSIRVAADAMRNMSPSAQS